MLAGVRVARTPSVYVANRPAAVPLLAAALAWVALVAPDVRSSGLHRHGVMATSGVPVLVAMTLAMMLPLSVSGVQHVVRSSAARRQGRGVGLFLAGFASTWVVTVLVLARALSLVLPAEPGRLVAPMLLFGAAVLQVTPWRGRLAVLCHWPLPLRFKGRDADVDCARYGVVAAWRCVRSCALSMAACLVSPHTLWLMVALTVVAVVERGLERPQHFHFALAHVGIAIALIS